MSDYDERAKAWLRTNGFIITLKPQNKSCPWAKGSKSGNAYRVTIRAGRGLYIGKRRLSFDFWGSVADADAGLDPTEYDVLACLASDVTMPDDPDEVAREFGSDMPPSQCTAIAKFAARLRAFFTENEREALVEFDR